MPLADDLLASLSDTDDTAGIMLFIYLLRRIPGLRQWTHTIALDPVLRGKFSAFLDGKITPPDNIRTGRRTLAWLAGLTSPALRESAHLHDFRVAPPSHGGLTRRQILSLIRRHQSGTIDCAAFLVFNAWRREANDPTGNSVTAGGVDPATIEVTMRFLAAAIVDDQPQLLHQLARAGNFFHGQPPGTVGRAHFGYASWWKLNLLAYMLSHPKPAYQIRELAQYLAGLKICVDQADIRRFCRKHKIIRDTRPGRPKNSLIEKIASRG